MKTAPPALPPFHGIFKGLWDETGEGNGNPLQYSCLENSMGRGAWWVAVHGVVKSRTRLSDFTFTIHFDALQKEMATCSSVLAWRIPGTVEPGGLPSMGLHRIGHDRSDLAAAARWNGALPIWDSYLLRSHTCLLNNPNNASYNYGLPGSTFLPPEW